MSPPRTTTRSTKPSVPLAATATILSQICEQIDAGAAPTGATLEAFKAANLHHKANVDLHITFRKDVEALIEAAKKAKAMWEARRKFLVQVLAQDEEEAKKAIQAEPDIPWSGELGGVKEHKNPPKLDLAIKVKPTRSFSNLLDDETIELFDIDEEFYKTITIKCLDVNAVKEAITEGRELAWASITQESRLEITVH